MGLRNGPPLRLRTDRVAARGRSYATATDLDAAVGAEPRAQDAPMLRERLGILSSAQLVQQLGGALDVGEEEGDGAGG